MQCAHLGVAPLLVAHITASSDMTCSKVQCSETATKSPSIVFIPPTEPPVSAVVQGAAIFSGVGAATAGVLSALIGSLAAFDAQALAAFGLSSCVPELASSTSPARFVVSPFYTFGPLRMVFGNSGLFLLMACVHIVALKYKQGEL